MAGPSPQPLENYDPNQVFLSWAPAGLGSFNIEGFEANTFIEIDYRKDAYSLKMDVSGSGTRSKTNDFSATITITLTQRSASNQFLSAAANADRALGAAFGTLTCRDNLGNDLFVAASAWIVKTAKVDYALESTTRVWKFETDNLVQNQGN